MPLSPRTLGAQLHPMSNDFPRKRRFAALLDLTTRAQETAKNDAAVASLSSEATAEPAADTDLADAPEAVREAVARAGWPGLMPVQARTMAAMLASTDIIVQSKTGSGKTGAFLLPLFVTLDASIGAPQALVMTPTRELARQIHEEFGRLSGPDSPFRAALVYGGVGYGEQADALKAGAQLVIGTPGRVLDLLERRTFSLDALKTLVLDEADEMLSMGFLPAMRKLLNYLPEPRQSTMFSATMPPGVRALARSFLTEPQFLALAGGHVKVDALEHRFYTLSGLDRDRALVRIIELENPESAIVFANTKRDVEYLAVFLRNYGHDAGELSGDLSQTARETIMQRVREGRLRFLIATDVAARGIDISDLTHVIQYDVPQDPEYYVHRAGRTARAGKTGTSITLATPETKAKLLAIFRRYDLDFDERPVPTEEEVTDRVRERLTVLLEDRFRDTRRMARERASRFEGLAQELATEEPHLLAMLLDGLYHDSLHALPQADIIAVTKNRATDSRFEEDKPRGRREDKPRRDDRPRREDRPRRSDDEPADAPVSDDSAAAAIRAERRDDTDAHDRSDASGADTSVDSGDAATSDATGEDGEGRRRKRSKRRGKSKGGAATSDETRDDDSDDTAAPDDARPSDDRDRDDDSNGDDADGGDDRPDDDAPAPTAPTADAGSDADASTDDAPRSRGRRGGRGRRGSRGDTDAPDSGRDGGDLAPDGVTDATEAAVEAAREEAAPEASLPEPPDGESERDDRRSDDRDDRRRDAPTSDDDRGPRSAKASGRSRAAGLPSGPFKISDLKAMSGTTLRAVAADLGVTDAETARPDDLLFSVLEAQAERESANARLRPSERAEAARSRGGRGGRGESSGRGESRSSSRSGGRGDSRGSSKTSDKPEKSGERSSDKAERPSSRSGRPQPTDRKPDAPRDARPERPAPAPRTAESSDEPTASKSSRRRRGRRGRGADREMPEGAEMETPLVTTGADMPQDASDSDAPQSRADDTAEEGGETRSRRSRGGRGRKSSEPTADAAEGGTTDDARPTTDDADGMSDAPAPKSRSRRTAAAETADDGRRTTDDADAPAEPKRRSRAKAADESDASTETPASDDAPKPRARRAKTAPSTEEAPTSDSETSDDAPAPKRRTRAKAATAEPDASAETPASDTAAPAPKPRARRTTKADAAETTDTAEGDADALAPKRRSRAKATPSAADTAPTDEA